MYCTVYCTALLTKGNIGARAQRRKGGRGFRKKGGKAIFEKSAKQMMYSAPLRATRGHTQADPEDAKLWRAKEGEGE